MIFSSLAVLLGLALLTYGADRFVLGASGLASSLGISPLIIGLTIVAFATSAPELLVAAVAAWKGSTGLAIGNAVGSNIANIGLVLGATAIITPLTVHSSTIRREFPLMFVALILALVLLWDGDLNRMDGVILVIALFLMISLMVYLGKQSPIADPLKQEFEQELAGELAGLTLRMTLIWLLVGLVLLLTGSQMLVRGAVDIAQMMGVSDLVIGLTIVAVGTSLPELATSVMSAIKDEQDIALGNVIGSNLFNILGVLSVPGLVRPEAVSQEVMNRDFPFMLLMSALMFFMAYGFRRADRITRLNGVVLLGGFIAYQFILFEFA